LALKGKCSICGLVIRTHRSKKNSASANFLKAMRKHQWKNHRNTMIARIKAGKARAKNNPSVQDMVTALREGPRSALAVYKRYTEKQYQAMKKTMDALEPILPPEVTISWKVLEAIHDEHLA